MTFTDIYNNPLVILSISTILSSLIVYKVFKLDKKKLGFQHVFYLGHVFFLSLLLFFVYSFFFLSIKFNEKRFHFTTKIWKSNIEQRTQIIDDLIDNNILKAKLEKEVVDLLGEPIRIYEKNLIATYVYYAGFRNKPFAIDPEFLIVKIENGQVKNYYIKIGL
jgi:hypothetical protein